MGRGYIITFISHSMKMRFKEIKLVLNLTSGRSGPKPIFQFPLFLQHYAISLVCDKRSVMDVRKRERSLWVSKKTSWKKMVLSLKFYIRTSLLLTLFQLTFVFAMLFLFCIMLKSYFRLKVPREEGDILYMGNIILNIIFSNLFGNKYLILSYWVIASS